MPTASEPTLQPGDTAPYFSLPGTDGLVYTPSDFDDYAALLVVFTCNHCPYAKAKIDELNHLATTYDDVAVVAINPNDGIEYPDDSFDRMRDLMQDGTLQYDAYLRDEPQDAARSYGAVCTPDPFLFRRRDGAFRLAYHGRLDDAMNPEDDPTQHDMRDAIDTVLAGDRVTGEFTPSRGCSIKWKLDIAQG